MTAAAVTNVRWPQTPRKAIPVMGISDRSFGELEAAAIEVPHVEG